jgi:mannose-6-phosphate isomerase-like protein (cupin superfamily)
MLSGLSTAALRFLAGPAKRKEEVHVRAIAICFVLTLISIAATQPLAAQTPAPATKTFASAADIQALAAKAKAEHKPGQPTVPEDILALAPYNVNLEYRTAVGPSAVHKHEAELFYVLQGTGTIVTGGKLVNEMPVDAENLTGTAIEGGASRAVAKGDIIIVPENTPHWYSQVNGTLILMSFHVPRPVPAAH